MRAVIVSLLLVLALQAKAEITFGSDNDCDYNTNQYTLQQVIDLHIPGQIRVTNQQTFYENIEINQQTNIRGGFTNCANANTGIATGKTIIDGGGSNSVIEINQFTSQGDVFLTNLNIKNGSALGSNFGGGSTIKDPNNVSVRVTLKSSLVGIYKWRTYYPKFN